MTVVASRKVDMKFCIIKEANDDDDLGGMTIQQWACLDGLSKSFKEDNT